MREEREMDCRSKKPYKASPDGILNSNWLHLRVTNCGHTTRAPADVNNWHLKAAVIVEGKKKKEKEKKEEVKEEQEWK